MHDDEAAVAAILGIPPEDVTFDMLWEYSMGNLEEGARSTWWPRNRGRGAR